MRRLRLAELFLIDHAFAFAAGIVVGAALCYGTILTLLGALRVHW